MCDEDVVWPELPLCKSIDFMGCTSAVLRDYAVPAIFRALHRSSVAWINFQCMQFVMCGYDYKREEYAEYLDHYVGVPVTDKVSSFYFDVNTGSSDGEE